MPSIKTAHALRLQKTALKRGRQHVHECQKPKSENRLDWDTAQHLHKLFNNTTNNPYNIPDTSSLNAAARAKLDEMCRDKKFRGISAYVEGMGLSDRDSRTCGKWAETYQVEMEKVRELKEAVEGTMAAEGDVMDEGKDEDVSGDGDSGQDEDMGQDGDLSQDRDKRQDGEAGKDKDTGQDEDAGPARDGGEGPLRASGQAETSSSGPFDGQAGPSGVTVRVGQDTQAGGPNAGGVTAGFAGMTAEEARLALIDRLGMDTDEQIHAQRAEREAKKVRQEKEKEENRKKTRDFWRVSRREEEQEAFQSREADYSVIDLVEDEEVTVDLTRDDHEVIDLVGQS